MTIQLNKHCCEDFLVLTHYLHLVDAAKNYRMFHNMLLRHIAATNVAHDVTVTRHIHETGVGNVRLEFSLFTHFLHNVGVS